MYMKTPGDLFDAKVGMHDNEEMRRNVNFITKNERNG